MSYHFFSNCFILAPKERILRRVSVIHFATHKRNGFKSGFRTTFWFYEMPVFSYTVKVLEGYEQEI